MPKEVLVPSFSSQENLKSGVDSSQTSESHVEAPAFSNSKGMRPQKLSQSPSNPLSLGKPRRQSYPLYPSVMQLLRQQGFSISEAEKIPASGPKGRLLKGDVLAYLGTIPSSYSSDQSARIAELGHLALSNIEPISKQESAPQPRIAPPELLLPPEPEATEIAIPISLASVFQVQKRIQATIGVTLPLSTFIMRATKLANDDLPKRITSKQTADKLFNDILGLGNVPSKVSKSHYIPQFTALPAKLNTEYPDRQKQIDIYDILTSNVSSATVSRGSRAPPLEITDGSQIEDSTNIFRVRAAKGEEKRARVFLESVKNILQVDPGRLIL